MNYAVLADGYIDNMIDSSELFQYIIDYSDIEDMAYDVIEEFKNDKLDEFALFEIIVTRTLTEFLENATILGVKFGEVQLLTYDFLLKEFLDNSDVEIKIINIIDDIRSE